MKTKEDPSPLEAKLAREVDHLLERLLVDVRLDPLLTQEELERDLAYGRAD